MLQHASVALLYRPHDRQRIRHVVQRRGDMEQRTAAGGLSGVDVPAMRRHDLAADGQAQTGAARAVARQAGLLEGIEDALQFGRRNARAMVAHAQADAGGIGHAGVDLD